jgi:hypothetical protein
MDKNGIGLECDLAEQRKINGGRTFVEDLKGFLEFRDLNFPKRIQIDPCRPECPDWIPEDFITTVKMQLPVDLRVQIVDDEGKVVASSRTGKELRFRVGQDFSYLPPENHGRGASAEGEMESAGGGGAAPEPFEGRRYFLEIFPSDKLQPGRAYPFTMGVDSQVSAPVASGRQRPGDCNQDGQTDISDAICILGHLFIGSPRTVPCDGGTVQDAGNFALLNFNGSGGIDISDAVALL